MKKFKTVAQIVTVVSLFMSMALPAHAAFPGSNGKVVYSDFEIANGNPTAIPFNLINLDGTNKTTLIDDVMTSSLAAGGGRFSADGKKIVFYKANVNTGETNLFTMNADGTNEQNITNIDQSAFPGRDGYSIGFGAFHPNGNKIVATELWEEDPGTGNEFFCHIISLSADGSNKQQLTNDPNLCDMYPVYSPDGARIAFMRSDKAADTTSLYVMNADGSNVTLVKQLAADNINPSDFSFAPLGTSGSTTDWSPDGTKLVYATYVQDSNDLITSNVDVTDLQGNATTVATFSGQQFDTINTAGNYSNEGLLNPQFTPEGQVIFRRVAVSVDRSFDSGNNQWVTSNEQGAARIQLVNSDGSNLRTVLTGPTLSGNDSNFILFQFSLPSVQPVAATTAASSATLANTGLNLQALTLIAVVTVLISLGFSVIRKTQLQ